MFDEKGYVLTINEKMQEITKENVITDIKKKLCYIALDYDREIKKCEKNSSEFEQIYELPDGQVLLCACFLFFVFVFFCLLFVLMLWTVQ